MSDIDAPTMRDWFATKTDVGPEGISTNQAKALMGAPMPSWGDDPVGNIEWWAAAEAKYRYLMADAMLAARKMGADAPVNTDPEVEKPWYPDDRPGWTEHDGSYVNPVPGTVVERLFADERVKKSYIRDPTGSDGAFWYDDVVAYIVVDEG